MEDNKEMLKESLDKIKGMMYYDSEKTAFENEDLIQEQGTMGYAAGAQAADRTGKVTDVVKSAVSMGEMRGYVRKVNRKMADLDRYYAKLKDRTYLEQPAVEALRSEYKKRYDKDLPVPGVSQTTPSAGTPAAATTQPTAIGRASYPKCQGGINKLGCRSNAIGRVQAMFDNIGVDGKFGPNTQKRLSQVAPEFSEQFTDADLPTIRAKIDAQLAPGKIDTSQMAQAGVKPGTPDKISSLGEEDEPEVKEDMFEKPEIKPGGATNMAPGFVNESVSNKEQKRINKKARLNKKLGITL